MQKELEEIKILLNKIDINNTDICSSETENIINNKVRKIKDFINQDSDETLNKTLIISQIEEILKLVASKEKDNSKIFEEFKNYLEKKK
tara:strand:+ start:68 stop:334 length:267 start_codon:yes stop_codon:yes gene_type:complete